MCITDGLEQFKAIAVVVIGFVKRRKRASMAVAVALLIAGPLLTGTGGETFFLNLVGLGVGTLVVRGVMQANGRRRTPIAGSTATGNRGSNNRRLPHNHKGLLSLPLW
jgi:hypothetical protein